MKILKENLLDHLQRPEFTELLSSLSPKSFLKGAFIGDIYSTHTRTFVQATENTEVLLTDVTTFCQKMAKATEVTKAMVRVLGSI